MKTLKQDPAYKRLKTSGLTLAGRTSYWLGPDHLLLVEVQSYTERYRRFRFDEIEAICGYKSARRILINIILLVLFLLFGIIPVASAARTSVDLTYGGALMVVFGGLFLWNTVRGPTCSAQIITAVQTTRLPGISRMKQLEKLIEAIQSAVQQPETHSAGSDKPHPRPEPSAAEPDTPTA